MLLSTFRSATRLGGSCATRRFHLTNPYLLASRFASSDNAHPSHVGSVGFYKKHILVGIGKKPWASRIEDSDAYVTALSRAVENASVKVSGSDFAAPEQANSRPLILFPDNIRIPSLESEKISTIAKNINQSADSPITSEQSRAQSQLQILVCTHGERDCRCGEKGGDFFKELTAEINKRGLTKVVDVYQVSHIGGHKYAGNAIVYPKGDWYGFLNASDVSSFLDAVLENKVVWNKWRGRMGLSKDDQVKLYQQAKSKPLGAGTSENPGEISITYILPDDTTETIRVPMGKRLMDVGKENDIPSIEGTCGGNLECATCHVVVDPRYADRLPPISDEEEDMLEYAIGRTNNSRLSCQLKATADLDGLRLMVPTALPRKFPPSTESSTRGPRVNGSPLRPSARAFSTGSTTAPAKRDFKSLSREYGPIALGVYLTLSFTTFCICLTSITVLGVDEEQIKSVFNRVKAILGFPPVSDPMEKEKKSEEDPEKTSNQWISMLPEWMRNPATRQVLTNVLLAMAMTKLFLPIKLGITAAITPMVARKLRDLGFQLGQKGGYKSAARKVKSEVKERTDKFKRGAKEMDD